MTNQQIIHARLANQLIAQNKQPATPADVVRHLGAMQAQDYEMVKWAVGLRSPSAVVSEIEQAIDDGAIVRTHLLRPTWHLAHPKDVRWMLALTGPNIKRILASNDKRLGIDAMQIKKSNKIITKALANGGSITRADIVSLLEKARISTGDYRIGHFLMHAELDGIVCNGPRQGKQLTYALLDERVPATKSLGRDEALHELALRYFTSHGPATIRDFSWWSGLLLTDAKRSIEILGKKLHGVEVNGNQYLYVNMPEKPAIAPLYLLPAFDEYLISYRDRSAALEMEHDRKVVGINGLFYPTLIVKGKVHGTWKRTTRKDAVSIQTSLLSDVHKLPATALKRMAKVYGHFLQRKITID